MSNMPPPPPPFESGVGNVSTGFPVSPAPLGVRFGAMFIDVAVFVAPIIGVLLALINVISTLPNDSGETIGDPVGNVGLLLLLALGVGLTAFVWTWKLWKQGTSPGKKMVGLCVVDSRTGMVADLGQMFAREFVGKFLLGAFLWGVPILIGLIMMLIPPRRAAVWDFIAHTTVVRRG